MCFVCIIALMMLATPQTTAEQVPDDAVRETFEDFKQHDWQYVPPTKSWTETIVGAMTTTWNLGTQVAVCMPALKKTLATVVPMASGQAPNFAQASYQELAFTATFATNVVRAVWPSDNNPGSPTPEMIQLMGFFKDEQTRMNTQIRNLYEQLEASRQEVEKVERKRTGDKILAAQNAAEDQNRIQKLESSLSKSTEALDAKIDDTKKLESELKTCPSDLGQCQTKRDGLENELGELKNKLDALNDWLKLLTKLFSMACGVMAWVFMVVMNVVAVTTIWRKLIPPFMCGVFCFFLPDWGAGFTLCAMVCCAYKKHQTKDAKPALGEKPAPENNTAPEDQTAPEEKISRNKEKTALLLRLAKENRLLKIKLDLASSKKA